MKRILTYNISTSEIDVNDFGKLYYEERRDSTFAAVVETEEYIYLLRDHLGIVPLYYRLDNNCYKYSLNLSELILPNDEIEELGLKMFVQMGTARLEQLISGIEIVPQGTVLRIDKKTLSISEAFRYKIKPMRVNKFNTYKNIVDKADYYFENAMKRLIRGDSVGLLFSGGMDSALIAAYLKNAGIKINAYTSSPYGDESPEIIKARSSARHLGFINHFVDNCALTDINTLQKEIIETYKLPHGTSFSIAIASIWKNSTIANEKQIFIGQNSDNLTCNVGIQNRVLFKHYLPNIIRARLKAQYQNKKYILKSNNILDNYVYARTKGLIDKYFYLNELCSHNKLSKLQQMSLAGMYFGYTPTQSEDLSLPAINNNILVSNPYYDMDLIEYILGIPLIFRLGFIFYFKKKIKFITLKPIITKNIIKRLALKRLPPNLVFKKKGFSIRIQKCFSEASILSIVRKYKWIDKTDYESLLNAYIFDYWWSRIKQNYE